MEKHLWEGGTPEAGCIDVYYVAAQWVVNYTRALDNGRSEADIPGLILYGGQLSVIHSPLLDILAFLAGAPSTDPCVVNSAEFWRQGVVRFMVSDRMMRGFHLRPGDVPPQGVLHHVEFRSSPRWLPFASIILGMEQLASASQVPLSELIFSFRGLPMLDGIALFNAVLGRPQEQDEIRAELKRWREHAASLVPLAAVSGRGTGEFLPPIPPEMRGGPVSRKTLAEFIGRTERQLRRWDETGQVPSGRKWFLPVVIERGEAKYDVEKNWPAVMSLSCRGRDTAKDKTNLMERSDAKRAARDDY